MPPSLNPARPRPYVATLLPHVEEADEQPPPGFQAFMVAEAPSIRGLPSSAALLSRIVIKQDPPPVYSYVERPPNIPIQGVVDHKEPLFTMLEPDKHFIEVTENGTPVETEVAITRFSRFGPYGHHPEDPSVFSLRAPFGIAICPTLAPYASARCGE
jgi:hypothetical protein